MLMSQQIGDVVDIDGAQSQSAAYDPTYGWSIWMNQRNLEVLQVDKRFLTPHIILILTVCFHLCGT
jgi:hypothetical protein